MGSKTKILIVEHDVDDLELLHFELEKSGIDYISKIVQTKNEYTSVLQDFIPDIILSDYFLPLFDGATAFEIREKIAPSTPFIFISGVIGEEKSIELIKNGATDYALKGNLFTLPLKIKRALRECKERALKNKADRELKQSEQKYRQIVETAQEGIWLIDENNCTTLVNQKMADILGYTIDEMVGRQNYDFMNEEWKRKGADHIVSRKSGINANHDFKYISKTGKDIWTNLFANPIFNDSGVYKGALAMVTDITESKNAEEKLKKVNRLYAVISQVNQNIVRIKDETELFHNACRIAFEFGKFKSVWIGLFDKVTGKTSLECQNGVSIDGISQFVDAVDQTHGLQDYVLKTGTYYLCNDLAKVPELPNWSSFAADHGICSAIILPIAKSGSIIGTFNLYSSESNFFDKEEIALLIEVSKDISFALDMFEKEKKQKETEQLIENNEKRFRLLTEKSVDMKTLSTPGGIVLYGSNSITKYLGYTLDEFVGQPAFGFIHPDDILSPQVMKEISEAPGQSFYVQQRMLHKKGSWIWCEGTITNMLHEPAVNALVSNFMDISEKKIAEQQKEFDSINLNALINNTTDLMWSVDRDFNLITFNQPFYELIKFVSGRSLTKGENIFSVPLSPAQIDRLKISYARSFAGETFTEVEYIPAPVKSWSEISYYPIRRGSEIIGIACHSRDITERKKAEEAVLYNLTEKNIILESIGDAFFAVDDEWTVTYWNNHAEKMLRKSKEAIVGKNLWDVFSDSIDSESYRKYHQAIKSNTVLQFEDYYDTLGRWYEISAYPSEKRLSVYFKDITDRKLSEIRLTELNTELKKHAKELAISNAELERFAYVASHDLQEPLRMITSFLTQLDKKYKGIIDDRGKQYIDFAVDGAKRMRQIILDLLEFSKVGTAEEQPETLDINELIKEIEILYRKKIEEKSAVIEVEKLPVIKAHKTPLLQIFQNLVSNALKYSKENVPAKIHINAKSLDNHWEFAVQDNGIGIAEEYYDKIFIIFQRLHNKDEYSGTGMGLAVTKKLIENLGGKIWIESSEGHGSTFYFTIKKNQA